jgi:hypothetical protein
LRNYLDPVTKRFIDVGNYIDNFGRPNNGDPDDFIFSSKKILSTTLFIAPDNFTGTPSIFLKQEEMTQALMRNTDLIN